MFQYLVIPGAILKLYGNFLYIKDTLVGKTRPNRVTWLMWSIAPMIAAAASFFAGASWVVLPVFVSGLGAFLIFVSSFWNKESYWKLGKFDYFCGLFSLLALILWWLTKEPLVAIILAIVSDIFAAVPTLKKSWSNPETETIKNYIFGLFNTLTTFFALQSGAVTEWAFSAYLLLMSLLLILVNVRRRFKSW